MWFKIEARQKSLEKDCIYHWNVFYCKKIQDKFFLEEETCKKKHMVDNVCEMLKLSSLEFKVLKK